MKKYDKRLLDISQTVGNIATDDLENILFKSEHRPKHMDATTTIPAKDPKNVKYGLDYETLFSFGKNVLEFVNKTDDYLLISLSIPSEKHPNITHAVAIGINKITKQIYFNNSYGIDLRKDIKDLLIGILPDYQWNFSKNVQQNTNIVDNSCAVLAIYNLLDMLDYFQDKTNIRNYNSDQARSAMWELLKDIEKPIEQSSNKKFKIFNFGVKTVQDLPEQKDTHKYKFYNEPDYQIQINNMIKSILQKQI